MKRNILIVSLLFLLAVNNSHAQKEGWGYHFSGFVDPQLFMDSRQVVGARESELLFYPVPKDLDAEGNDLNAVPNLNMLAITTRLRLKVDAPMLGEWSTSAYVEGDFTGSTENGIRAAGGKALLPAAHNISGATLSLPRSALPAEQSGLPACPMRI